MSFSVRYYGLLFWRGSGRSDFGKQIGMPVQHLEQFHECQRRLGFPFLVT